MLSEKPMNPKIALRRPACPERKWAQTKLVCQGHCPFADSNGNKKMSATCIKNIRDNCTFAFPNLHAN